MAKTANRPGKSSELIRAEAFDSSLHARTIGGTGVGEMPAWRLVFLDQGRAELQTGNERLQLDAPCVTWQPWDRDMRVRIAAGAVGMHMLMGSGVLANAIGHKPEAPELRFMTERRVHLALSESPQLARWVRGALALIVAETREEAAASRTVIEAALRIVLVGLWRAQGAPEVQAASGSSTRSYLGQFNTLVEVHFRDRWTVSDYAAALGITPDRLNDICRRGRGRTPREIIAARTGVEARLLLENSLYSLDQIASQLGFPSTAQFNRFFKAVHNVPPGQYRRQHRQRLPHAVPPERGALFEWP